MEILRINNGLMRSQGGTLRAGQPLYVRATSSDCITPDAYILSQDSSKQWEGISMIDLLESEKNLFM